LRAATERLGRGGWHGYAKRRYVEGQGNFMKSAASLLNKRRFLPIFATQFLNAFNDNFFKMAMVILATYTIYDDPQIVASFNAWAAGIFILPFFLFSAMAGQLSDSIDKRRVILFVKTAEIVIMMIGAVGIYLENVPIMFGALFLITTQSTFFGPIKYGILPQHLEEDEVLAGTGFVEAGTYIAILSGTIVGGLMPPKMAAVGIIAVAFIGRFIAHYVPTAPPEEDAPKLQIDWNIFRGSWRLLKSTMHVRRIAMAIWAISFFWAIGAVLGAQFPPMVKDSLGGDNTVATMFTAVFSIGIAIGSVAINRLLKGEVSAKFAPASVIVMGICVLILWWVVKGWERSGTELIDWRAFLSLARGDFILLAILGISIFGGMFVVPLYAFLTTTVNKSETARINSGAMVLGTLIYGVLAASGVSIPDTLFLIATACVIAAWLAHQLHKSS